MKLPSSYINGMENSIRPDIFDKNLYLQFANYGKNPDIIDYRKMRKLKKEGFIIDTEDFNGYPHSVVRNLRGVTSPMGLVYGNNHPFFYDRNNEYLVPCEISAINIEGANSACKKERQIRRCDHPDPSSRKQYCDEIDNVILPANDYALKIYGPEPIKLSKKQFKEYVDSVDWYLWKKEKRGFSVPQGFYEYYNVFKDQKKHSPRKSFKNVLRSLPRAKKSPPPIPPRPRRPRSVRRKRTPPKVPEHPARYLQRKKDLEEIEKEIMRQENLLRDFDLRHRNGNLSGSEKRSRKKIATKLSKSKEKHRLRSRLLFGRKKKSCSRRKY